MAKRMLIDATHAEETRVVVLDGNRLEDFDVETSTKKQLKGNIYLAKVVRVEPSLQAAFVEYGGNRHGFLAFGEIHPDYYQIPVADRQRLLAIQAEEARQEEEAEDRAAEAAAVREAQASAEPSVLIQEPAESGWDTNDAPFEELNADLAGGVALATAPEEQPEEQSAAAQPAAIEYERVSASWGVPEAAASSDRPPVETDGSPEAEGPAVVALDESSAEPVLHALAEAEGSEPEAAEMHGSDQTTLSEPGEADASFGAGSPPTLTDPSELAQEAAEDAELHSEPAAPLPPPETVGGDADGADEARDRRVPPRFVRNYKIQEVIHRRQILLVQVVKEERGTKGAALTTYLSLAGRYCVLMPNSPRGGGISRKITSAADRRRLKDIVTEFDIPKGMGLIVRTAGANRPKPEIKRDCEYLLRLWDDIREHTMRSVAPALIYEEASLIKRAIRDVYSRDIDEVLVDGEDGWKAARDFMRMLMPSHAKKVQMWRDGGMPLFAKHQIEAQLDAILTPTVQLRSGGYLVINQTEALVSIDVNSGRSTRERNIEETALRTNLEAADEVARQLRLRDLAGLVVIDFIDMESRKHNGMVERRLKDALKNDRARIQIGHISHFGLLEMSRQRLRPSLAETSFITCPHCGGTGHVRGTESAGIHVLRHIEEEGARRRSAEIVVHVAAPIAMYLLNFKRERLREIETRYAMKVTFEGDDSLTPPQIRIVRVRAQVPSEVPAAITPDLSSPALPPDAESADLESEEDEDEGEEEGSEASAEGATEEGERRRRRRRRRRKGSRRDEPSTEQPASQGAEGAEISAELGTATGAPEQGAEEPGDELSEAAEEGPPGEDEGEGRGRRRGRRGGRRRRREGKDETLTALAEPGAEQPEVPFYQGPTPANPFGGQGFDIFEVMERAEQQSEFSAPLVVEPAPRIPEPASTRPLDAELSLTGSNPEATAELTPVPEPAASETHGGEAPELDEPGRQTVGHEPEPITSGTPLPEAAASENAVDLAASPDPAQNPPIEPQPEQEADVAAREPRSEPAIQPIVIGGDTSEPVEKEKKRGWWRR